MSNDRSTRPSESITIGIRWLIVPASFRVKCNRPVARIIRNRSVAKGGAVEIVREVVFPAPPEEVWEALTEPERLEEWFANEVELDARPGGAGVFRWGDGDERHATVREAEPAERLVLDWDDAGEVVFTLEEVPEG